MAYTCKTCGAVAEEPGHLCAPSTEPTACAFCGEKSPHVKHYCKGKMEDIKYVCRSAGGWRLPRICSVNPAKCRHISSRSVRQVIATGSLP